MRSAPKISMSRSTAWRWRLPRTRTRCVHATVGAIESQLVDARVWIGFHYRHSVIVGENLGNSVAAWTLDRFFLPKGDDREGDED